MTNDFQQRDDTLNQELQQLVNEAKQYPVDSGNPTDRAKRRIALMPAFGKRTPLTKEHFLPFEEAYGDGPNGGSPRIDLGELGRWRCFKREDIAKRGENLDITWLRDESLQSGDDLLEPDIIAAAIMAKLQTAMEEMAALTLLLEAEEETEDEAALLE